MSIDHKAYLFDHHSFDRGLAVLLYKALERNDVRQLRVFILEHRAALTDQWTEGPLGEDWEQRCQDRGRPNVQCYADLALMKYYDCTHSLGLSYGFDPLLAYLRTVLPIRDHADDLICGRLFGPKGKRLDPGLMGTGILVPEDVRRLHTLLEDTDWPTIPGSQSRVWGGCLYRPSAGEVQQSLSDLQELYRQATEEDKGILLVDFNDCGVASL